MTQFRPRHLVLSLLAAVMSGCWSSDPEPPPPESEPTELKPKEEVTTDASQDELVKASKRLYEARMFSVAKQSFQNLRDNFPGGPYSLFADLKMADCHYYNHEFYEAAAAYQEYYKNNPGTVDVPYAKLQAARSFINSNRGVGRDKVPLEKALAILDSIIADDSTSPLVPEAKAERLKAVQRLADQEKLIADFYSRQDKPDAAKAREVAYNEKWAPLLKNAEKVEIKDRPMIPIAVARKTTSSLPVPSVTRVRASLAPPKAISATSTRPRPTTGRQVEQAPNSGAVYLQKVQCKGERNPFISMEVSRIPADGIDLAFEPRDGKVTFRLKGLVTDGVKMDCFGEKDLTITPNGVVTLLVDHPVKLTSLAFPPRLLVTLTR